MFVGPPLPLSAEPVQWRALQIATPTPSLPGLERLRRQFPTMRATPVGLVFPLETETPEEILARCVAEGVRVAGSVIMYAIGDKPPAA